MSDATRPFVRLMPRWIKQAIKDLIREIVEETLAQVPPVSSAATPATEPLRAANVKPRTSQYLGDGTILTETFFGRMIFVDGKDNSLSPHIIHGGRWEQWLTDFIIREVRPGHAFLDIGANLGFYTLLAAHLVGATGKVVAFEPQKRLSYLLGRSIEINGFRRNTILAPLALGDREEVLHLNVDPNHLGGGMVRPRANQPDAAQTRVTTLPTALAELQVDLGDRPLFIKMDIEGFEYSAWLGMRDMLTARDKITMVLEFTAGAYRNQGHDPFAFVADMRERGFRVSKLSHQSEDVPLKDSDIQDLLDRGGFIDVLARK